MRIGLIAMSGVRACDAELMAIGLTLPGVVERSKVIAALPSLGLLTLAGATPAHHECRYFEVQDIRQSPDLPSDLAAIGQPVLIPGDMGRCSYVLVGTAQAMTQTFGSTADARRMRSTWPRSCATTVALPPLRRCCATIPSRRSARSVS